MKSMYVMNESLYICKGKSIKLSEITENKIIKSSQRGTIESFLFLIKKNKDNMKTIKSE